MKNLLQNNKTLAFLLLVFAALLPALIFRQLNPTNELNYLAIGADALKRGTLFAFYQDGAPYADKPPLYLWLGMVSYKLMGCHGFLLLLGSALPFIYILYLSADYFARGRGQCYKLQLMLCLCAALFMLGMALTARMDMLFAALIMLCSILLCERLYLYRQGVQKLPYGLALPLAMFAAIFVKGPYALIFPLAALLFATWYLGCLKDYFKIFRPYFFLILLACTALWGLCVYFDGGLEYLKELFVGQSSKRLSGSTGHPEPFYWYLTNIWYLAMPAALPLLYIYYKDFKSGFLRHDVKAAFCAFFVLAVLVVVSIPSSKLEIYVLPALPFALIYLTSALERLQHERSVLLRLLLGLNFLPFVLLFPALFFFTAKYPFLSSPFIYGAALLLSLGALIALVLTVKNQLVKATAQMGGAMLAFIFVLAFALPQVNPYLSVEDAAMQASRAIDEQGAPHKVCVIGIAKEQNLVLYDPRFEVLDQDPLSPLCQDAQIIVGRSTLRSRPELKAAVSALGGVMVGDNMLYTRGQSAAAAAQ
ncbi:MAG: hypothetical protein IAB19_05255 [Proteobacteria bacterium]|uniref:Glycosyltransferase RgtA/B/C/D-like domain-containing protein n=1 Tax=Candidatus Avisuccinivibrio stercorigallinarum TaxID=2840704 RepID=A0A9D9DB12_9GAMM|nr:hypothetical protein [Candidatus Avisuccinivibrio stercorigallinarum]